MSLSPRDIRRLSKTVKANEGDRGGNSIPNPSNMHRGPTTTIVKLLQDLEDDNEVDAVYTYWSGGWNDDATTNKFKVKGFGAFGTHVTGTRGICVLSGDTWFFAIPWSCPETD